MDARVDSDWSEPDGYAFDHEAFDEAWFAGVLGEPLEREGVASQDATPCAPGEPPAAAGAWLTGRVARAREFISAARGNPWADLAIRFYERELRKAEPRDGGAA